MPLSSSFFGEKTPNTIQKKRRGRRGKGGGGTGGGGIEIRYGLFRKCKTDFRAATTLLSVLKRRVVFAASSLAGNTGQGAAVPTVLSARECLS